MKRFSLYSALLLSLAAHATGTSGHHNTNTNTHSPATNASQSNAAAQSNASAHASASAAQQQAQQQVQQQQQSQTATGGNATATGGNATAQGGAGGNSDQSQEQSANANNAGNNLSVTNKDRLQAPAISAPAIYASNSCATGWSAGLSIPGGGLSGGKSKADPACDRREAARVLMPLNPALALKVLCDDPHVKAVATAGDCVYSEPVITAPAPAVTVESQTTPLPDYATKEELDRAVRLLTEK